MPLHSKHSISKGINDEVFGSGTLSTPLPKYQFPENETAARDAVLQHRPARDGPRPIRACRRTGRSGSGGVVVACALGQLGSRSRAYLIFPTATSEFTGQGKWQAGPSVVVGYLTKEFFLGVFPQQWWSIGGEHGRPNTNQMNLQPIATLFFGEGWSIGYSGNFLADWTAPSEDVWTVPAGSAWPKW